MDAVMERRQGSDVVIWAFVSIPAILFIDSQSFTEQRNGFGILFGGLLMTPVQPSPLAIIIVVILAARPNEDVTGLVVKLDRSKRHDKKS